MIAIAILASITFAASDTDGTPNATSNIQLPIEAYVITGKVTAALLPTPLRATLEAAITTPKLYYRTAPKRIELGTPDVESLVRNLTDAFKARTLTTINNAATSCVRLATRVALGNDNSAVSRLIAAHHKRLVYEVRVDPDRLTSSPDVVTLSAKLSAASSILHTQFDAGNVDFNLALVETHLEQGALLSAKMLTEAWRAAGEPILAPPSPAAEVKPQESAVHLASKNSKVFHKPTCPHVARIKQANVVRFESFTKAKESGRKPCKTCKPAG